MFEVLDMARFECQSCKICCLVAIFAQYCIFNVFCEKCKKYTYKITEKVEIEVDRIHTMSAAAKHAKVYGGPAAHCRNKA